MCSFYTHKCFPTSWKVSNTEVYPYIFLSGYPYVFKETDLKCNDANNLCIQSTKAHLTIKRQIRAPDRNSHRL